MKKDPICIRCVMDTTAPEIRFDAAGICSFCHFFDQQVQPILDRACSAQATPLLHQLVEAIRRSGQGKPYDCLLGLSGGTDSSYLAYLARELGLRPLLVHVDTGWNTPESEANVKNLAHSLGFDLQIIPVDWEEMCDLQIAFYKASVKNCEIPQDHGYLAALYRKAEEIGVHYILSGGNLATESILPRSWGFNTADLRHLKAIHRRFGKRPLRNFPTLGFWKRYVYYPFIRKIREVRLLNFVPYSRTEAKRLLQEKVGWQDYGAKHYESVLTRFFQGYYLPTKFGIDKRKAHFSSLILAGQMSRQEALEELKKPPYPSPQLLQQDKAYIAQKLGLALEEWEAILAQPPREHKDFPNSEWLFQLKEKLVGWSGLRRRRYGV
ncbi:MAG: N-acetyl sugar amidotransferase [Thermoguttaceae bacterium]|nr:N-acetyl sugar amidotransferase [Thermoguttaceae bacterium]MDW8038417.1 N-acetyl sugar amidotransferase [Thermoguttaceae bacterium]